MQNQKQNESKKQEVRSFVGRQGEKYVIDYATTAERKHFEGTLYKAGIPDLAFLSYITSNNLPY